MVHEFGPDNCLALVFFNSIVKASILLGCFQCFLTIECLGGQKVVDGGNLNVDDASVIQIIGVNGDDEVEASAEEAESVEVKDDAAQSTASSSVAGNLLLQVSQELLDNLEVSVYTRESDSAQPESDLYSPSDVADDFRNRVKEAFSPDLFSGDVSSPSLLQHSSITL